MTKNYINLFKNILTTSNELEKQKIDELHNGYVNNYEFISEIKKRLRNMNSIDDMIKATSTITGKYFKKANSFLQNEDFEHVTKCIAIIDIACGLLYEVIRSEYSKCDEVEKEIESVQRGIELIKKELANGILYTVESQLYD